MDAANSGMTCLEHSAAFRGELRCDLCQLIKPYDDFSKSQRKNDDPMCKRCTAWTETQEPDVTPWPLETGHVSVEEMDERGVGKGKDTSADFFPIDAPLQAPVTSLSALGFDEKRASNDRGSSVPPHLADTMSDYVKTLMSPGSRSGGANSSPYMKISKASDSKTSTSSVSDISSHSVASSDARSMTSALGAHDLPPHLRQGAQKSKSGREHIFGGFQGPATFRRNPASISTATTMREQAEEVTFNAWDNSGQRHDLVKSAADQNYSSASSNSGTNESNACADWTDAPVAKRKGGWHKAPMRKQDQEASGRVSAQHLDPDVDRQRRLNYCASDDS